MENADDAETAAFVAGQNKVSSAYINKFPHKQNFHARFVLFLREDFYLRWLYGHQVSGFEKEKKKKKTEKKRTKKKKDDRERKNHVFFLQILLWIHVAGFRKCTTMKSMDVLLRLGFVELHLLLQPLK